MDLIQYIPKYKEEVVHGFPNDSNKNIKLSKYFIKSLQQRMKIYFEEISKEDVKETPINSEQIYFTNM
jgi:hypothetical protein